MFSVHTKLEEFKYASIIGYFGFVFEKKKKTLEDKSHDHCDVIVLKKRRSRNIVRPHFKAKPSFSNFSS